MIIHKVHYRYEENENWACRKDMPREWSYYWGTVTCKNCLKQQKKRIVKGGKN